MACPQCGEPDGSCSCTGTPDPQSLPSPPPGWYADPAGSGGIRWWAGTAWTAALRPPAEAPIRKSATTRTLAIGAAIALLVGTAALATISRNGVTWPRNWDPRVASIAHFVEVQRGLTFVHPVPIEYLPSAAFERKIGAINPQSSPDEQQSLNDDAAELRALGLAQGSFDLGSKGRSLLQSQAVGVYMSHDKRVYVRGSDLTPSVRVVLAHELTHALQDQHGDLVSTASDRRPNDVRLALIEGDAVVVQRAYADSLSVADKATYNADQAKQGSGSPTPSSGVDDVLANDLAFPYVFGPVFIDALRADGGTSRIDQAYLKPPTSEAEIVDPARYLAGFHPVAVASPALQQNQVPVHSDDLGQVSMLEVLGARLGYTEAWQALQGWQGDSAMVYREAGSVCVAVVTAFDSPGHAAAYMDSATAWAAPLPRTRTSRSGTAVELRSCDPGVRFSLKAGPTPPPFEVLSARAELLDALITRDRSSAAVATCTIDQIVKTLGPTSVIGLFSSSPDVNVAHVRAVAGAAALACQGADTQTNGGTSTTVAPSSTSIPLDPALGAAPLASAPVWPAPDDPSTGAAQAGLALLPAEGTIEHIHAHVAVVIDGRPIVIPALVGIGSLGTPISEMHTHDTSGIVHVEAAHIQPFTLGQFFIEWGHPLGANHVGAIEFGPDRTMHVFVNGVEVAGDPATIVLHERDDIAISVDRAGAPVTAPLPFNWPSGY